MSKHQGSCSVPFAACAAIVLGGLAAPAPGQNRVLPRLVPEKHFTLAPSVEYDYVGARSIDRHTLGVGLRIAFYSHP